MSLISIFDIGSLPGVSPTRWLAEQVSLITIEGVSVPCF